MPPSSRITIRNPSLALLRRLESLSEARGESVNTTILRLLEETLGIHQRRERLRRYATWTDADQAEFEVAFEAQRTIDEALWR